MKAPQTEGTPPKAERMYKYISPLKTRQVVLGPTYTMPVYSPVVAASVASQPTPSSALINPSPLFPVNAYPSVANSPTPFPVTSLYQYPLPSYQSPAYGNIQAQNPYPAFILSPCTGAVTYTPTQMSPCLVARQRYVPQIAPLPPAPAMQQPIRTYPVLVPQVPYRPCINIVGCMNIYSPRTSPYRIQPYPSHYPLYITL